MPIALKPFSVEVSMTTHVLNNPYGLYHSISRFIRVPALLVTLVASVGAFVAAWMVNETLNHDVASNGAAFIGWLLFVLSFVSALAFVGALVEKGGFESLTMIIGCLALVAWGLIGLDLYWSTAEVPVSAGEARIFPDASLRYTGQTFRRGLFDWSNEKINMQQTLSIDLDSDETTDKTKIKVTRDDNVALDVTFKPGKAFEAEVRSIMASGDYNGKLDSISGSLESAAVSALTPEIQTISDKTPDRLIPGTHLLPPASWIASVTISNVNESISVVGQSSQSRQ
ncbi:MAG: hypothetical protein ACREGR_03250 [Minisyncoccia bacterium]